MASVARLHLILLGIHGLPSSIAANEDVGEDAAAGFFAEFVAGDYDAVDDGTIDVEPYLELIEARLACCRGQMFHVPADMLIFGKEDSCGDGMYKVGRQDTVERRSIAGMQPLFFQNG